MGLVLVFDRNGSLLSVTTIDSHSCSRTIYLYENTNRSIIRRYTEKLLPNLYEVVSSSLIDEMSLES